MTGENALFSEGDHELKTKGFATEFLPMRLRPNE